MVLKPIEDLLNPDPPPGPERIVIHDLSAIQAQVLEAVGLNPNKVKEQIESGEKVWGFYEGAVRPVDPPAPPKPKYVVMKTEIGAEHVDFLMCLRCGALTLTEKRHDKWHKKLQKQLDDISSRATGGIAYYG